MNVKLVMNVLGKVMIIIGLSLLAPIIVSLIYAEDKHFEFIIPMASLLVIGAIFRLLKPKENRIYAREGFVIVALSWIVMSVAGAIPFMIEGVLPNFADALFESVSGFTTTGASVIDLSTTTLSKSLMFWRLFTHFIGGMGVLVFLLAVIPQDNSGLMYMFKAESPGPSSSKFVSKMGSTARLLYLIYVILTAIEFVMLLLGGMNVYESLLNSFSTAGTGGFGIYADSLAHYNTYSQVVIGVFMLLFGVNFNVFYLILIGKFAKAFKSEEVITYFIILFVAVVTITLNIYYGSIYYNNFFTALKDSFVQVTSISSTTGFASADFTLWPSFSKGILLFLTVMGACGGSTGGGIKVSRLIILVKSGFKDMRKGIYPRSVQSVNFEGETLDKDVERGTRSYFILWMLIVVISTIVLSIDTFSDGDVFTNLSATLACLGNVGPGLTTVIGPFGGFAGFSSLSKVFLSLIMLMGRLEIFPIILLLAPRTWKKYN